MSSLEDRDRALQQELDRLAGDTQAWLDKNEAEGIFCDFCCWPVSPADVITFLADATFSVDMHVIDDDLGAGTLTMVYEAPWASCPGCAPLVEAGDPAALAAHSIANQNAERTGVEPSEEQEGYLVELYEALFSHNPRRIP